MEPQPTVFVVDDDASIRKTVGALAAAMDIKTEMYTTGEDFLKAYDGFRLGCVVLEVMVAGTSGLEIQEHLAASGDRIPLVFLSVLGNVPIAVRAMRGGAFDYLVKPCGEDKLWDVVRDAVRLSRQQYDRQLQRRETNQRLATLSEKEHEVLGLVAAGKSNRRIARELNLSERTVQHHRSQLMKKLKAKSLIDLVYIALTSNGQSGHSPIPPRKSKEDALLV